MQDIAEFLKAHPPFDAADAAEVDVLAAAAEIEFHTSGVTIFSERTAPVEHLRVIRKGAVEIRHDGHVLDLLGPGELFGHTSMLSGLPPGFAAVAVEDTLCYRIPADAARPLLGRPAGLRYVARSLSSLHPAGAPDGYVEPAVNPAQRPVGDLFRQTLVVCRPEVSIRDAARRMTEAGATSAVVDLGDGRLGILTDRDLRQRVVADGLDTASPISAAMTAPAYTVSADRLGGEVLLEMLERGIRHVPVCSPTGEVLGVLEDSDLAAVSARSSFHLRTAIARADSFDALAAAAAELRPTVISLHEAKVAATDVSAVYSVVADALTRRLIELAVGELGEPSRPFSWLALGSLARREAVPSSDVDSALVWFGDGTEPADDVRKIAERVMGGLEACGFPADRKGAVACNPMFARSASGWQAVARSWLTDPTQDKALILVSLIVDGRPVWGLRHQPPVPDVFSAARRHPDLLRLLGLFALGHRPPTGFMRDFVVEHSGERRGTLDLKRGGLLPIVDLARWAGMAAGVTSASTPTRLQAAARAGTLDDADARTLQEAFELILWLRLDHQISQLAAGVPADDHVRPGDLSQLTRSSLKEAFRAVASVQRRISASLQHGVW